MIKTRRCHLRVSGELQDAGGAATLPQVAAGGGGTGGVLALEAAGDACDDAEGVVKGDVVSGTRPQPDNLPTRAGGLPVGGLGGKAGGGPSVARGA